MSGYRTAPRPGCFAVKGAGGSCARCEALIEGSQVPRTLSLDIFVYFVLSLGSGLARDGLIPSTAPLASSEEKVNAEGLTAPPLTATLSETLQARQEIEKLPGERNAFLCAVLQNPTVLREVLCGVRFYVVLGFMA